MGKSYIAAGVAALLALAVAAPAIAFTPEKTSRIDRLINEDSDAPVTPAPGPKVSDPTAKALSDDPAFKEPMPKGPVGDPAYAITHQNDRLVLEPPSQQPLNGGIKLD